MTNFDEIFCFNKINILKTLIGGNVAVVHIEFNDRISAVFRLSSSMTSLSSVGKYDVYLYNGSHGGCGIVWS